MWRIKIQEIPKKVFTTPLETSLTSGKLKLVQKLIFEAAASLFLLGLNSQHGQHKPGDSLISCLRVHLDAPNGHQGVPSCWADNH